LQKYQDKNGAALTVLIGAASLDATTTPATWDVRDGANAIVDLAIGAGGITFTTNDKIEFELTHAEYDEDTGVIGSYSNVETGHVLVDGVAVTVTSGIVKALTAAHAAATAHTIEYVGPKGALKFRAVFSGTHGVATPLSAIGRLQRGRNVPAIAA
jgi:hypothetical protein